MRGLHRHNERVDVVGPGSRVAANLSGIDKSDLTRGDVLASSDAARATRRVDAKVRVVTGAPQPLRHGAQVLVHAGTAEVAGRVIVIDADEIARASVLYVEGSRPTLSSG